MAQNLNIEVILVDNASKDGVLDYIVSDFPDDYYIKNKDTIWEKEPLENLARDNQLAAYKFDEFWYAMDTLRDKNHLESLWLSKKAPWKVWSED